MTVVKILQLDHLKKFLNNPILSKTPSFSTTLPFQVALTLVIWLDVPKVLKTFILLISLKMCCRTQAQGTIEPGSISVLKGLKWGRLLHSK